jgi:hypothetical protein
VFFGSAAAHARYFRHFVCTPTHGAFKAHLNKNKKHLVRNACAAHGMCVKCAMYNVRTGSACANRGEGFGPHARADTFSRRSFVIGKGTIYYQHAMMDDGDGVFWLLAKPLGL